MKKHNFYAGPSILSEYTIKNAAAAVENFAGTGLSILCWKFHIVAKNLQRLSKKLKP